MNGFKWISAKERLPEESGRYLAAYCNCTICDAMNYSAKYKAFNVRDELSQKMADNNQIPVDYWAEIPVAPYASPDVFNMDTFSKVTGIYPDYIMEKAIESMYEQEKDNYHGFTHFCGDYKADRNATAQEIQIIANGYIARYENKIAGVQDELEKLKKDIAYMKNSISISFHDLEQAVEDTQKQVDDLSNMMG